MTMLSQMEYCIGYRDDSRRHVEELLNNCKTVDEMLPLYIMKMESLEAEGFDSRAISVGVETLWLLGEPITKHPHLGNVLYAYN